MQPLVLGSTSPYRRELLARLRLPFSCIPPRVNETPLPGEAPDALVRRLAEAKARAVVPAAPDALIIGSDQVAVLGETILGKPGSHERAKEQLMGASGKRVDFLTGLSLVNGARGSVQTDAVVYSVLFRELTEEEVEHYLQLEQPYDCAGSFKSEGLGVALFQRMEGGDPTALIGLPLIRLLEMLRNEGVSPLKR